MGISSRWILHHYRHKRKSINQWFSKCNAQLQSIKEKQGMKKCTIHKQNILYRKHNNWVNDDVLKTAHHIIYYCFHNNIGVIVIDYLKMLQSSPKMGKRNNPHCQLVIRQYREKTGILVWIIWYSFYQVGRKWYK